MIRVWVVFIFLTPLKLLHPEGVNIKILGIFIHNVNKLYIVIIYVNIVSIYLIVTNESPVIQSPPQLCDITP
jgi:hypothetical protein